MYSTTASSSWERSRSPCHQVRPPPHGSHAARAAARPPNSCPSPPTPPDPTPPDSQPAHPGRPRDRPISAIPSSPPFSCQYGRTSRTTTQTDTSSRLNPGKSQGRPSEKAGLEAHRPKRPTRPRSPKKAPVPDHPTVRSAPDGASRGAFSCPEEGEDPLARRPSSARPLEAALWEPMATESLVRSWVSSRSAGERGRKQDLPCFRGIQKRERRDSNPRPPA